MAINNMTPEYWREIMDGAQAALLEYHEEKMRSDPEYRALHENVKRGYYVPRLRVQEKRGE